MGDKGRKKQVAAIAIILFAAFAAGSCRSAPLGGSFVPTKRTLDMIKLDKSTRSEVHEILGSPHSPGVVTELWEFKRRRGKTAVIEITFRGEVVAAKSGYNLP